MNSTFDPQTALKHLANEYGQRAEAIRRDLANRQPGNTTDQPGQRQNDDVLRGLLTEAEQGLQDVQHAMERLQSGHYGECRTCGEAINPARLAALPTACLCLQCAEQSH